jgi:hypothetical protein
VNEALVLLVLIWAAMLIPGALRSRNASPHVTVGGFERAMDVLRSDGRGPGPAAARRRGVGREVLVPRDALRIVERSVDATDADAPRRVRREDPRIVGRRTWFVRLLAASTLSTLLALLVGSWLWLPTVLVLGATSAYVVLLRRWKLQRDEARRVVRELELHRDLAPAPERVVVGGEVWASGTVKLRRWDD